MLPSRESLMRLLDHRREKLTFLPAPCCSRDENVDLDAKFAPNLLNSAIFLLSTSQQVSTFAVNFIGRPFREDISESAALKYGLLGASGVAVAGAIDFMPEFNKWLQIVEMDVSGFSWV
jgi:cation-transporting ATPase 13A1